MLQEISRVGIKIYVNKPSETSFSYEFRLYIMMCRPLYTISSLKLNFYNQ